MLQHAHISVSGTSNAPPSEHSFLSDASLEKCSVTLERCISRDMHLERFVSPERHLSREILKQAPHWSQGKCICGQISGEVPLWRSAFPEKCLLSGKVFLWRSAMCFQRNVSPGITPEKHVSGDHSGEVTLEVQSMDALPSMDVLPWMEVDLLTEMHPLMD